jgi:hypothetical protein
MCWPMVNKAVARQTEIEALEPRPEPIGMADRRRNVTFVLLFGLAREM